MDSVAVFTNCRNSTISPFLRSTGLVPTAGSCYQSWKPVAVRWLSWPARKASLTSGVRAATRDFGVVGELLETKHSFYELLGIQASGSYDDIKRAYKHLARKYHPDVSPPDRMKECTQLFIRVNEAYETLSDPGQRALYDRHLAHGHQLSFSTRTHFDKEMQEKSCWQVRLEDQLVELSRRSMRKNSDGNLSWAARMRRRRAEASAC